GNASEAAREILLGQAPMHLVKRNDVDIGAPQGGNDSLKEPRGDFQHLVWLESTAPRRPNVMQHQNGADAAKVRLHETVDAAEIQRLETSADQGLLHVTTPLSETAYASTIFCWAQSSITRISHTVPAKIGPRQDVRTQSID